VQRSTDRLLTTHIELMHMLKQRQLVLEDGDEGRTAAALFYSLAASCPSRQGQPLLHDFPHSMAVLAFLRRPAIGLGAGTAHQHRPFTVAQAVGLAERLDGLCVVDDRKGAGPVGAP